MMQSPSNINPLYSVQEIALYWNLTEKFILSAVKSGALIGLHDGKDFKTQAHHIEHWLQTAIVSSTQKPVLPETRGRKPRAIAQNDPYLPLLQQARRN